jgi:Tol biopolymer transport system component
MNFRIAIFALSFILLTSCGQQDGQNLTLPTPIIVPTKTERPSPTLSLTLTATSTVTPFPPLSGNPPYLMLRDEQSVFLYDNDGHGRQIIQLPLDGHIFSPLKTAVSPDGQWLAFYTGSIGNTGYDEKLPVTLNLLNLTDGTIKKVADIVTDGYQQKLEEVVINLKILFPDFYKLYDEWDWVSSRVTFEFIWRIYSVAWSPDSHYLAFAGQIDGLSSDVYLYDIDLDTIQRVNDDLQSVSGIKWSPDGKYIVFENSHPGYTYTGSSLYAVMPSKKVVKDLRPLQYSTWWSIKGWLSSDQLLISE